MAILRVKIFQRDAGKDDCAVSRSGRKPDVYDFRCREICLQACVAEGIMRGDGSENDVKAALNW